MRLVIGGLDGVSRWGSLACWLLAPAIAASAELPSQLVGVLVLCGSILGSWLFLVRLGRRRKAVAVSTAALLALPLLALADRVSGTAAAVALVALGSLTAGSGAALSAVAAALDPRTRQRRLVPVSLASSVVAFASGPVSELVADVLGWPVLFRALAIATIVVAVLLAVLCPHPDRGAAPERDATVERDERGSTIWLTIGMFGVTANGIAFAVFMPLAAVDHAVPAIGWTQIGLPISAVVLLIVTRLSAAGQPRRAPEWILWAAALMVVSACPIALLVDYGADEPTVIFAGWLVARVVATVGGTLYAFAAFALVGASARSSGTNRIGVALGQLLAGIVGASIWSSAAASVRYDLVLGFGLACGLVQLVATRRWRAGHGRP